MLSLLTPAQRRVYDFYTKYIKDNWKSPTYSIASDNLWISEPSIYNHIKKLESLGYVTKDNWWNISLSENAKTVRILGNISCWYWIDVIEDEVETIEVPSTMIKPWFSYYWLIAKGDSMIKANIEDNDILIIRQQSDVDNGDIAVVVREDEIVTLKRIYKRPSDVLLKPENDDFPIMILKDCQVRWKLVWVIRSFNS